LLVIDALGGVQRSADRLLAQQSMRQLLRIPTLTNSASF
jgi:hypothetical protein